jgi:hypothetical protein
MDFLIRYSPLPWPVFGLLFLDSWPPLAISPEIRRGIFLALFVFAWIQGIAPLSRED